MCLEAAAAASNDVRRRAAAAKACLWLRGWIKETEVEHRILINMQDLLHVRQGLLLLFNNANYIRI